MNTKLDLLDEHEDDVFQEFLFVNKLYTEQTIRN